MATTNGSFKTVVQKGYSAVRRWEATDTVELSESTIRDKIAGDRKAVKAPANVVVALFGADDEYIARFEGSVVTVTRFADLGKDEKSAPLCRAKVDFAAVKVRAAGRGTPMLLLAIDTRGKVWSIDFQSLGAVAATRQDVCKPRYKKLAEKLADPIHEIVVLDRKLVLQHRRPKGGYDLHVVDRRTGLVTNIGSTELDPDIAALTPGRHDILLGRVNGELRLLLFGEGGATGAVEIHEFDIPRVTAAAVIHGTHLVVARKGGLIEKVDIRTAVPEKGARSEDPLVRACRVLRTLLKRCGCGCSGKDTPGDGTITKKPCDERHSARLSFTADKLYRVGDYVVALDRGATRMAVMGDRLNVQFERKLDRAGADVLTGQAHTQNMLVYQPRKAMVEAWGVADYVSQLAGQPPDDLAPATHAPLSSVTFWGQKTPLATPNPTLKVCIFPVIEPGQEYGDPDMNKLIDQISTKMFTRVDDYYLENSFGEMTIDFATFGYDVGEPRKPLVLPRSMASYWYDAYRSGGLEFVMPADWSDPVFFDGTEALQIKATPRAGAVKTYNVPFAAMWSSGSFTTFPVEIEFDGSETLELAVETQEGDSHNLVINFPAFSRSLDEGGDIDAFLTDLGTYVTDAIRDAESNVPGDPTLIQDVEFRRIPLPSDADHFGLLQGRFRIQPAAPADVSQKGRLSVSGPVSLAPMLLSLGLSSASIMGRMDSTFAVGEFIRECLYAAQVDKGELGTGDPAYFLTSLTTSYDAAAEELTIEMKLLDDVGGQQAQMEVVSSSGLASTGWDVAVPVPGSESSPNNSNALRDGIELADDTFTAAIEHIRATTAWNREAVEAMFAEFDVMMIAHVGAPHSGIALADQWDAEDPVDFSSKRMYKRTHHATDKNPPADEAPVQMATENITGQRFNQFDGPELTNQSGVMAHELGHALGLPDLYSANGYRDDVLYVDSWAMMGGGNANFHHFCGWSKWALGWIADDSDPDINRTIFVDLPEPTGVSVTEAWLVPVEYWDNAMRGDVRDEVGGDISIGQLMKINLGSDGGVTAFLELRADGAQFSQNLSPEPAVIATNGLHPESDRSWAVNGLYRRSVHLLNNGNELRAVNDKWDFAAAPEFPIKGCTAEVAEIRTIRGSIPVYRVRVERESAEYIDLHFQDHVPSYMSPDIWIDWTGDNPDPNVPRTYPVGTPTDQGETVRYPESGTEKHFVVARVHNAGNVRAETVKVRWYVCDPPGAGDDGRWVDRGTKLIAEVGPDTHEITPFEWLVDSTSNVHQCMRMEIIDWTIPEGVDPDTGDTVALASDDVKLQNNIAQQNVFDFEALSGSPFPPIHFPMQVHNDRNGTEVAALVPNGLPYGSKLTISPREWAIPSGEARVFNCTLQLDDAIILPGCDNDSGFLLTAWRRGGEADEKWGSCFYHVRPRFKTGLELVRGTWSKNRVKIYGRLLSLTESPLDFGEDMPLYVRIRMLLGGPGGPVHWRTVAVQANGLFLLDTEMESDKPMIVQAWFDRNERLGSAISKELHLHH